MELKFYSGSPRSISRNIWLRHTEAVLPPLSAMIMIRLKALTGETWTDARRWEQFAAQSTADGGGRSAPLAADWGWEKSLEASQPQEAAGDSTVPIVRFHYTHTPPHPPTAPRTCLSLSLPLFPCPCFLLLINFFRVFPTLIGQQKALSTREYFGRFDFMYASQRSTGRGEK